MAMIRESIFRLMGTNIFLFKSDFYVPLLIKH